MFSMEFAGGRKVAGQPSAELPGKVNYVLGRDPGKWQLGLATYQRVDYRGIYPNVDVAYCGNQQHLEFDLALRPGADPRRIRMKIGGVGRLAGEPDGTLSIGMAGGEMHLPRPTIYGNAYVTGWASNSSTVPATSGVFMPSPANGGDAFVAKFSTSGALTYCTYLGGSGADYGFAIAADSGGSACVSGYSESPSLTGAPTGGVQTSNSGMGDAFVAKLKVYTIASVRPSGVVRDLEIGVTDPCDA